MEVYTTDKFGVPKLVTSEPVRFTSLFLLAKRNQFDLFHWNRIVVSIDLEKNIFATQFLSEDGIFTKTLNASDLNYDDWVFDDTIQVYLGQSNGNGSPAAKMLWRSFAFDYAAYSEDELYHFLFQGNDGKIYKQSLLIFEPQLVFVDFTLLMKMVYLRFKIIVV